MYFITGATGGLGKAFAMECASRGWDLFLTDLGESRLAMLASGLMHTYGVDVHYRAADLTDASSRAELFEHIRAEGWKFQGLINVAGLDYEGLFMERSQQEISSIVRLNIEATLIVTHTLLDYRDEMFP
ncbi:MAG TPA: SDR family NAD(P)-dependent oxidoreductase, partial [Anaerolineales bacterium]|nr:SDR family NAD(P)-dependent oxidoreductase [Anaerolineales bacterium]